MECESRAKRRFESNKAKLMNSQSIVAPRVVELRFEDEIARIRKKLDHLIATHEEYILDDFASPLIEEI